MIDCWIGYLSSIEGELTTGYLVSLIIEMGQFGITADTTQISSTYRQPDKASGFDTQTDYKIRFRQYIDNYNDRAQYSLACVIDGICPVNYKN